MRLSHAEWSADRSTVEKSRARRARPDQTEECLRCGRPLSPEDAEWFEMLVDLTLLVGEEATGEELDSGASQGGMPLGRCCARIVRRLAREKEAVLG